MEVTADDNCLFMLDFGGSTFAVIDSSFNAHAATSPRLEIFGRKGTLNLADRNDPVPLELYRMDAVSGVDGWVTPRAWHLPDHDRVRRLGRAVLVDHLVDCVREKKAPILSAEHARHALEIMLKVTESARTGKTLELTTSF
jgi:predicted dehydrogenase